MPVEKAAKPNPATATGASRDWRRWIALQSSIAPSIRSARNARAPSPSVARVGQAKCDPERPRSTPAGSRNRNASPSRTKDAATVRTAWPVAPTAPTTSPPRPAPAAAPTLYQPWNDDITARFRRASTATPWAFMATSRAPIAAPNRTRAATSVRGVAAWTGSAKAGHIRIPQARHRAALPNRLIRAPATGMAVTPPAAMASRIQPNTPVPTPSASLASGICGTQPPVRIPHRKKIAETASRARSAGASPARVVEA